MLHGAPWLLLEGWGKEIWEDVTALVQVFLDDGMGPCEGGGQGGGKRVHSRLILKAGTSLVVQWLRLCAPNVGGSGLIPSQGTRSHTPQLTVHLLQLRPSTAQ